MEDWIYYCSCVAMFTLLFWLVLVVLSADDYNQRGERIMEFLFIADSIVFILSLVTLLILKAIDWIWF